MSAYYNENDPYCAQWLRNLISENLIAKGDVDDRSIKDVRPDDVAGYRQCRWFAGIGGWSLAARLAGWPDERELWTGSCPCQPFSAAGKRRGIEDERHLWPEFARLIAERNPAIVVGEQVASKDGRIWLAGVRADLEALGYAVGAADLCAAGVGAPHIRQRLYWVADSDMSIENERASGGKQSLRQRMLESIERLGDSKSEQTRKPGFAWQQSDAIECLDGWRRIESGAQPLEDGVSKRMDKIRGYGNAIVPQLAAEFISAVMECQP